METAKKLTNLQLELLKVFRFDIPDDQLLEIRSFLRNYFANKVTSEMDQLFESNQWGEEKIEEWSKEHMRTKYEGQ
ncbi:MAG: hypothetical protein KBG02_00315 [Haliscomenobacter sp.]|nr:hypothetical protein [Haliscomenobacter sp.]MBK8654836.1 hypothetical protein [Haliscomenobacter sp.]MBP9075273.1 hypothetical protein [Haliscomenobacter sp.]